MPITPDLPFPKNPGDSIRSKDWNDVVTETQRLDGAKVDRAGDTITGTLTIAGALGVGTGGAAPAAKLQVAGAIMPAAGNTDQGGILFPPDPGGGSLDSAWVRYYARVGEAATLELGTSNDADDHIALMPSGRVGIGTLAPGAKLDVNGDAAIQGLLTVNGTVLATGPIYFNPSLGSVTDSTSQSITFGQADLTGVNMTFQLPVAHRVRVTLFLQQVTLNSVFQSAVNFQVAFSTGLVQAIGSLGIGTFTNQSFSTDLDMPAGATTVRAQWLGDGFFGVEASTSGARTLSVEVA